MPISCNFRMPGEYFWPELTNISVPNPSSVNIPSVAEPDAPNIEPISRDFTLPRTGEGFSGVLPSVGYTPDELLLPTLSEILFPVYTAIDLPSVSFDVPEDFNVSIPDMQVGDFINDFQKPLFVILPKAFLLPKVEERLVSVLSESDFTWVIPEIKDEFFPVFDDILARVGLPLAFRSFSYNGDIFTKIGQRLSVLDSRFNDLYLKAMEYLRSLSDRATYKMLGQALLSYVSIESLRLESYSHKVKSILALLKLYSRAYFANLMAYQRRLDSYVKSEIVRFESWVRNVKSELESWRANVEVAKRWARATLKGNSILLDVIRRILELDGVYRSILGELLNIHNAFIELVLLREEKALFLLQREVAFSEREVVQLEERQLPDEEALLRAKRDLVESELEILSNRYSFLLREIESGLRVLRSKINTLRARVDIALVSRDELNIRAEEAELNLGAEAVEVYSSFLQRTLSQYISLVKEVNSLMVSEELTEKRLTLMKAELDRELGRLLAWYDEYLRAMLFEMYQDFSTELEIATLISQAQITSRIIEESAG